MHELSVCLSLLKQVERIAREHNASVVNRIVLKVGPLSGVEPALLKHAYPLAAAGTVASDAELIIGDADVVVRCSECGAESQVPPNRLLCSQCGDFRTNLVSGDEMLLQSVEFTTRH
jgi:hydrogenase nickel incorporation protein HypA/HybF